MVLKIHEKYRKHRKQKGGVYKEIPKELSEEVKKYLTPRDIQNLATTSKNEYRKLNEKQIRKDLNSTANYIGITTIPRNVLRKYKTLKIYEDLRRRVKLAGMEDVVDEYF